MQIPTSSDKLMKIMALVWLMLLSTGYSQFQYRVNASGFKSSKADIRAVLDSAARPLIRHFPNYKVEPVEVRRGRHGPLTLFQRSARGEIIVQLDTHGTFWSQYAYQWAHELCHVLAGFREDSRENKWFEETLCETASHYALRAMAKEWQTKPPYPNWKGYAPHLSKYAKSTAEKYHPLSTKQLSGFYKKHEKSLRGNHANRDLNGAMALALLPKFEAHPAHWESIRYLNVTPAEKGLSFSGYLSKWHRDAPKKHHTFIESIATWYGVSLH